MTDEEKKAVDKLKRSANYFVMPMHETTIILNLIEKQEKEIEKLKTKNSDLLRKLRNRVKDVKKLQKYGAYKKEFSNLNKRIEKQSKMIDLMAEQLTSPINGKEWVIKYYEKKVGE